MADLLVDDHEELGALLAELVEAFGRGEAAEVLPRLDLVWARLAVHIRAEHLHLFPALLDAAARAQGGDGARPSPEAARAAEARLREDHDFFMRELAAAVNETKGIVSRRGAAQAGALGEVRRRVEAVVARLAEHNRLEEEQVYLWQRALLDAREREELSARMRRELENLPPRFAPETRG
jgi:hypothetical protein